MSERQLDKDKTKAFGERMVTVMNNAAQALMLSIGHRTGLFDVMAQLPWADSRQIADKAGLNERYVREWLAAMVVSRVIEYDPSTQRYALPPEHAASLTRAASPGNLAVFMQYVALLGAVEDGIVSCFRNGGGLSYSEFHRVSEVQVEDRSQAVIPTIIDSILPLAPGVVDALQQGANVLDVGCGSGQALNLMGAAFPSSRFVGYDFNEEVLAAGRAQAESERLTNVCFVYKDVSEMDEKDTYDLITAFDAVHDQAKPATVLRNIARALKPDGTFIMQDITASSRLDRNLNDPLAAFKYTFSTMHCMTVSLAQGGAGLGAMWGKELALEMLKDAGLHEVTVQALPHDIHNGYYVCKRSR